MKHDLDYMIAVMQAAKEGKEIECRYKDDDYTWGSIAKPHWNWGTHDYRVKPEKQEPKIVPYESAEEFLQAQKEHGLYIKRGCVTGIQYDLPTIIKDTGIVLYDEFYTYNEITTVRWADDAPCGKLKQQ